MPGKPFPSFLPAGGLTVRKNSQDSTTGGNADGPQSSCATFDFTPCKFITPLLKNSITPGRRFWRCSGPEADATAARRRCISREQTGDGTSPDPGGQKTNWDEWGHRQFETYQFLTELMDRLARRQRRQRNYSIRAERKERQQMPGGFNPSKTITESSKAA